MEGSRTSLAEQISPKHVLEYIWRLKERDQVLIVNLLWHWWTGRNRVREGERRREP